MLRRSTGETKRIGRNIRAIRKTTGLSMEKLAMALGVSHQQVQKYERGHNRISVDMLAEIAAILEVPISEFFVSYDEEGNPLPGPDGLPVDIRLEIGRTAHALHQLPPRIRRPILQLIDELSDVETP